MYILILKYILINKTKTNQNKTKTNKTKQTIWIALILRAVMTTKQLSKGLASQCWYIELVKYFRAPKQLRLQLCSRHFLRKNNISQF